MAVSKLVNLADEVLSGRTIIEVLEIDDDPAARSVPEEYVFAVDAGLYNRILVKKQNRTVGQLQWHKQNHFVDLHYIGIKRPHRGKGLAVALLKILADTLKHEGAKRVCAAATWKGALRMMIKAWGKPVYLADDIDEYTLDKAMQLLADRSPEKYGRIETGYYINVCYEVPKLPPLDFDVNWE